MTMVHNLLLAFSETDPFSRKVFEKLVQVRPLRKLAQLGSVEIYEMSEGAKVLYDRSNDLPFIDYLDRIRQDVHAVSEVEYVICISRHEMRNPRPLLTVHTSGNWAKAEYGGVDEKVSKANARLNCNILRVIKKLAEEQKLLEKYGISLEATHHGPSLDIFVTFVEVGSTINEWLDDKCHRMFLDLIEYIVSNFGKLLQGSSKVYAVVGDLHYSTLVEHVLNSEYDIGHIIPKYVRPSRKSIVDSIERTYPRPDGVIIHWKSVDKETRELVSSVVKDLGLELVKRK